MDKLERELQAQQLNCIIAHLGTLCRLQAEAHGHFGMKELIDKNSQVGEALVELTNRMYRGEK